MMAVRGAPNCMKPQWTPEELAIIGVASSVNEAWENHTFEFGELTYNEESLFYTKVSIQSPRSYKAIECKWLKLHPKLPNKNTALDRELKIALDELEAML